MVTTALHNLIVVVGACQEHGIFFELFLCHFSRLFLLLVLSLHILFSQFRSSKKRQDACYNSQDVAEHNVQLQWTTCFKCYLRGLASG